MPLIRPIFKQLFISSREPESCFESFESNVLELLDWLEFSMPVVPLDVVSLHHHYRLLSSSPLLLPLFPRPLRKRRTLRPLDTPRPYHRARLKTQVYIPAFVGTRDSRRANPRVGQKRTEPRIHHDEIIF